MNVGNNVIEVIYIAYRPDKRLYESVEKISFGALKPDRIRIMLTVDKEDGDEAAVVAKELDSRGVGGIVIETVPKCEFSHGGTRQKAMMSSKADFCLLMTQDAVPVDGNLVSTLFDAVSGKDAAVAYARQVAYPNASKVEKMYRLFNYPRRSMSKTAADMERVGVKAFFSSDVCCMYKKTVFESIGGFDPDLQFNEDSIYAFHALKAGYTVEYAANARVYHSHDLSYKEMFKRSKAIAASQKAHSEIFGQVSSEHEGIRFLILGCKAFFKKGDYLSLLKLIVTCVVKYAGFFAGKHLD